MKIKSYKSHICITYRFKFIKGREKITQSHKYTHPSVFAYIVHVYVHMLRMHAHIYNHEATSY